MKKLLLITLISFSAVASVMDVSSKKNWRPLVYEYLSPVEQTLLDRLDNVNSTNFIIIDHLLSGYKTEKCFIESEYKNNRMNLKITDTVSDQVYSFGLKSDQAKFGLVHKSEDFEYLMVITDTFENLDGILITGSTYSLVVKLVSKGEQKGQVVDIHVISSNKTIFDGALFGFLGEWLGRKPVENGLDFHCSLEDLF